MEYVNVAGHKLFRVNYEDAATKYNYHGKDLYKEFTKLVVHNSENDVIKLVNSWPGCRVTSIELVEDDISMKIPKDFLTTS